MKMNLRLAGMERKRLSFSFVELFSPPTFFPTHCIARSCDDAASKHFSVSARDGGASDVCSARVCVRVVENGELKASPQSNQALSLLPSCQRAAKQRHSAALLVNIYFIVWWMHAGMYKQGSRSEYTTEPSLVPALALAGGALLL
jgi:hypothetical protein